MSRISSFTLSALFLALGLPAASVMLSAEAMAQGAEQKRPACDAQVDDIKEKCKANNKWEQDSNGRWLPVRVGANRGVQVLVPVKGATGKNWQFDGPKCQVKNALLMLGLRDKNKTTYITRCPGRTSKESVQLEISKNADFNGFRVTVGLEGDREVTFIVGARRFLPTYLANYFVDIPGCTKETCKLNLGETTKLYVRSAP